MGWFMKDMEKAREIVEVNRGVAGGIGTPVYLASLERDIAAALASARREALESAASIVNSKRGETFDLRGIVAEIRALIEKD